MALSVQFGSRFNKACKRLTGKQQERLFELIEALPKLISDPHRHTGFGFRKLRGLDFYEARLDLRLRVVMKIDSSGILLFDVLNHDQVRRL